MTNFRDEIDYLVEQDYDQAYFASQFEIRFGYDPRLIYCLVTGAPIGASLEFNDLIDSLSGTDEEKHEEIALRLVASMRPSMRWNRHKTESLNELRKAKPVETVCYLLNRLLTPVKASKDSMEFQRNHANRIRLYQHLNKMYDKAKFDSLLLLLLEIDAKLNLLTESSPITYGMIFDADDALAMLTAHLTPWHDERVEFHRTSELNAHFFSQNPGARKAFSNLWMEVEPSETRIKQQAKQQAANFMASVLDELIHPQMAAAKPESRRPTQTEPAKPVAMKSTVMPKRFGIKKVEG